VLPILFVLLALFFVLAGVAAEARRRSRFSASGRWFSSAVLGSTQVRMVFSATKRVMSSMWPWVSSPAQPRCSQRVWLDAEVVVEGLFEQGAG
jgi:hypothetical protein